MAKATTPKKYSEIDDIKGDINSLKNNAVELTKHIQRDGAEHAEELKSAALEKVEDLRAEGTKKMKKMEKYVKAKPSQSLVAAFAAGLVVSFLFGRR